MRPNEEDAETLIQEELSDDRIEKLGQRVTLLSILLPLLFIAVTVLIYVDLNKRVALFQSSGTTEVQALAENTELQLDALMKADKGLTEQQGKLEESLKRLEKATEQVRQMLETSVANRAEVQKIVEAAASRWQESATRQIASKLDREALDKAMADMEKSAAERQGRIRKIEEALKTLQSDVEKEHILINGSISDFNDLLADFTRITGKMEARISAVEAALETTVEQLPTDAIGPDELQQALQEEKEIYRQMLRLITRNLERRLESLREELEALQRRPVSSSDVPSATSPDGKASPTTLQPSLPPLPDSGEILEQSIE
jgi:chromosome segregation ATPase